MRDGLAQRLGPKGLSEISRSLYNQSMGNLYMTQGAYDPHSHAVKLRTDEGYVNESELERKLNENNVPPKEKKLLKDAGRSINQVSRAIERYRSNGELQKILGYLPQDYKKNINIRWFESSNVIPQAIAYTDTHSLFGVNSDYDRAVRRFAEEGRMDKGTAELMIIVHELVHMSQPREALKDSYTAELDAERRVRDIFLQAAKSEKDYKRSKQYLRASGVAGSRYQALSRQGKLRQRPSSSGGDAKRTAKTLEKKLGSGRQASSSDSQASYSPKGSGASYACSKSYKG